MLSIALTFRRPQPDRLQSPFVQIIPGNLVIATEIEVKSGVGQKMGP